MTVTSHSANSSLPSMANSMVQILLPFAKAILTIELIFIVQKISELNETTYTHVFKFYLYFLVQELHTSQHYYIFTC